MDAGRALVSDTTYSFDTSALVDWWVRHYSPEILPSLKTNVETVIAEGRFKASRYVLTELEQGGDELHEWAKLYKDEIFIEDDEAVQRIARTLIQKYSFPDNPKRGLTGADPFVIARAQSETPFGRSFPERKRLTPITQRFLTSVASLTSLALRSDNSGRMRDGHFRACPASPAGIRNLNLTQQRESATQNRLGQKASVEPRIPRLAGSLRNQQAGMTGGTLQRVVFASLTVLGANGIIGAKRKALRPSR
jgi:hypothetical protein